MLIFKRIYKKFYKRIKRIIEPLIFTPLYKRIKLWLKQIDDNAMCFNKHVRWNVPRKYLNFINLLKRPLYKEIPPKSMKFKRFLWYLYYEVFSIMCLLLPRLITTSLFVIIIYIFKEGYIIFEYFEAWVLCYDPLGQVNLFYFKSYLIISLSYLIYYIIKVLDFDRKYLEDENLRPLTLWGEFDYAVVEAHKCLLQWMEKRAQEIERIAEEKKIEEKLWFEKKMLEIKKNRELEEEHYKIREKRFIKRMQNKNLKDKKYKVKDPVNSFLLYLLLYVVCRETLKSLAEAQRYAECSEECFVLGCKCPPEDECSCYDKCVIRCVYHKQHEMWDMFIEMLPNIEETQNSFSIFSNIFLLHFFILILILFLYIFLEKYVFLKKHK